MKSAKRKNFWNLISEFIKYLPIFRTVKNSKTGSNASFSTCIIVRYFPGICSINSITAFVDQIKYLMPGNCLSILEVTGQIHKWI